MLCGTIEVDLTDSNQNADYAIGVSGDPMEPDHTGEDIVYVQKATHLDMDDIGIFQKDNCIYIKKVGDGELVSINPNYEPIPGVAHVSTHNKHLIPPSYYLHNLLEA